MFFSFRKQLTFYVYEIFCIFVKSQAVDCYSSDWLLNHVHKCKLRGIANNPFFDFIVTHDLLLFPISLYSLFVNLNLYYYFLPFFVFISFLSHMLVYCYYITYLANFPSLTLGSEICIMRVIFTCKNYTTLFQN